MTGPESAPLLPLSDIRVVELAHMVMGPTCGMILGDLGAEVIKVEPKGGDKTRNLPGLGIGFFRTFNRNKKSVTLDAETSEGHAQALELIDSADVLIENFRPGRMDALGLGYAALAARNPKLIYVSHKGFLPGPYSNRLALDEVVQMMGGLAYMTGPIGRPLRAGSSVNDIMGGMFGAIGVLAALWERERTGKGQEIQSALFENCVFLCAQHMQQYAITGEAPAPMPARASAWGIYDIFELSAGERLFIAAVSDTQWETLCRLLDRPELLTDVSLKTNALRVQARPTLLPRLAEIFKGYSASDLASGLERVGLPYAAIRRPEDLFHDPHLRDSGGLVDLVTDTGATTQIPLLPLLLGGRRLPVRRSLPRPGEHNDEVFGTLFDGQPGETLHVPCCNVQDNTEIPKAASAAS